VSLGVSGFKGDGPANQIHRNVAASCLPGDDAEVMKRARVVWLLGEDLAIELLGLVQPPGLVMLQGNCHRLLNRRISHIHSFGCF
jgi:hypothetical protein